MIKILNKKDGAIVLDRQFRPGATVEDAVDLAEKEYYSGFADYAAIFVDGKLYVEYES